MAKVRVLIVDDSALIRKVLTEILSSDPDIEVVGTANDPYIARDKIKMLTPDVITLDVEMPKMDGISFLKNLMRLRPMPVVMISTLTDAGAAVTLQALELGAIDYVPKPKIDVNVAIKEYSNEIIEKVKVAAAVPHEFLVRKYESASEEAKNDNGAVDHVLTNDRSPEKFLNTTDKIIAIGSSTGGTEAVKQLLMGLPVDVPGIVVTQHIPVAFSKPFADRLNKLLPLTVTEAVNGDLIVPGKVYIAPGDKQLLVRKSGAKYFCKVEDGEFVNRHKPSVEVLFKSVAQCAGPNALGIMLTGMGSDGAEGMLEMKKHGALNIAQDEKSSVVWGMPGAAVKAGAVDKVLPLNMIADEIIDYCKRKLISN